MGITRAKKRAQILYAANRRVYGKWQSAYPSRFIDELPKEHIVHEINPGLQSFSSEFKSGQTFNVSVPILRTPHQKRALGQDLEFNGTSWEVSSGNTPPTHSLGERVFHQKFGYGRILDIDGNKLEIEFEKAGIKKVLESFVQRHQTKK